MARSNSVVPGRATARDNKRPALKSNTVKARAYPLAGVQRGNLSARFARSHLRRAA